MEAAAESEVATKDVSRIRGKTRSRGVIQKPACECCIRSQQTKT